MFRKMISFLLVIVFSFMVGKVSIIIPVGAIDDSKAETKVFDTATMDDDFTDDCVMVILNNAESLKFRNYTASDFPEVACKSVEDLSSASAARVQAKLRGDEMETRDAGAAFMNKNVNVDTFRTILCLKLETPGKGNVLKAIRALEQREDVYYAGPNYIITLDMPSTTSSDTSRGAVLPDIPGGMHWYEQVIELSAAWQKETGSSTVKVGILDSGIDASHYDLNGRVSTSLSHNFAPDNVSATTDRLGHGTHVAGIIGGEGNNNQAIIGVCQNVTLVSLRVLYPNDAGKEYTTADIVARTIEYAEEKNIPILNLSINADYIGQSGLIQAIEDYSGIVVCSAGNDNRNSDVYSGSNPAMVNCDNIISVGASAQGNIRASFSNYGSQTVDLFAPGDGIASCFPKSLCAASNCPYSGHIAYGYHYMDGTSMATPFVTGAAALLLSSHPNLTASEIKELILDNTTSYSAFSNICVSGGVLNINDALSDPAIHQSIGYESVNDANHRKFCNDCDYYSCIEEHTYVVVGRCRYCGYQ